MWIRVNTLFLAWHSSFKLLVDACLTWVACFGFHLQKT